VLGPLNRMCRAVLKIKKISYATFKNATLDTCRADTDRHACRAVSLSYCFVSCRALTREHDFRTLIDTQFVRSNDQLADIFTKGLDPKPFEENIDKLGLIDIYNTNLRGVIKLE
jgi:hypothetical protein